MRIRTWLVIGAVTLVVAAGAAWWAVRAAQAPPRPGDTVDLPQSSSPEVPMNQAPVVVIGGLSSSRDNRCVTIQPVQDPQAYEGPPALGARWPRGYEGRIRPNGDFVVVDAHGHVVAREGDLRAFRGRWARASDDSCLAGRRVLEVTAAPGRAYFAE